MSENQRQTIAGLIGVAVRLLREYKAECGYTPQPGLTIKFTTTHYVEAVSAIIKDAEEVFEAEDESAYAETIRYLRNTITRIEEEIPHLKSS